jgi:hypothetical protein
MLIILGVFLSIDKLLRIHLRAFAMILHYDASWGQSQFLAPLVEKLYLCQSTYMRVTKCADHAEDKLILGYDWHFSNRFLLLLLGRLLWSQKFLKPLV